MSYLGNLLIIVHILDHILLTESGKVCRINSIECTRFTIWFLEKLLRLILKCLLIKKIAVVFVIQTLVKLAMQVMVVAMMADSEGSV